MSEKAITLEELLSSKDAKKQISKLKFEQGMELVENLVSKVESGNMALDKAVDAYELAAELVKHLKGLLSEAEGKLKVLQQDSDGNLKVK